MQDADWKKRHAALICLSQIAEGCVKVLTKNISGLADLCLMVRTPKSLKAFLLPSDIACVLSDEPHVPKATRNFLECSKHSMGLRVTAE